MLDNPIKEKRNLSNKYTIGYYSINNQFESELQAALNNISTNIELVNLTNLDEDSLKLYLSSLDEVIFDSSIQNNVSQIANDLNVYTRTTDLKDLSKILENIEERSKLTISLKKEKNFGQEKDLKFIMQIVSILENKDPYTKDHSARVAKYALAIGNEYFEEKYDELYGNLKEQNPEQFEKKQHEFVVENLNLTMLAAWSHDIGKNSIAQNLINKDSKLTESEYDLMKMHADFGAEMVRKIIGNEPLAEAIENHHERIDGFGYHNLTEFSDIAKIIAIADSFDSMTTTRPYTTKLENVPSKSKLKTVQEAITELQISSHPHYDLDENRMSQQLDTTLTDIFVRILKRDLTLIQDGKNNEAKILTSGIDNIGFLKTGFWDDKTQEYIPDQSVLNSMPNLFK